MSVLCAPARSFVRWGGWEWTVLIWTQRKCLWDCGLWCLGECALFYLYFFTVYRFSHFSLPILSTLLLFLLTAFFLTEFEWIGMRWDGMGWEGEVFVADGVDDGPPRSPSSMTRPANLSIAALGITTL